VSEAAADDGPPEPLAGPSRSAASPSPCGPCSSGRCPPSGSRP